LRPGDLAVRIDHLRRVPTFVDFFVKISSVASLMVCLLASVPVRIAQPQQAVSAKTFRNVWLVTALPE
jgi:hypothetical protein